MLSPDEYLLDPQNSQNYNKYSYALNNPIRFTDPTGNNPYWVWEKGQLVEKQETKAQKEKRERFHQWQLNNAPDGSPRIELDYFAAADRSQNRLEIYYAQKMESIFQREQAKQILQENASQQRIVTLINVKTNEVTVVTFPEYQKLENKDEYKAYDKKEQISDEVFQKYLDRMVQKGLNEMDAQSGGGASTLETVANVADALDKSLTLNTDMLAGALISAKSLTKETFKVISDVPILRRFGQATGAVGFIEHSANFIHNPNWTDGLEAAGQLGIWGAKLMFPEALIIDAIELGYNNATMIYDSTRK
jgi:hypothetical protein